MAELGLAKAGEQQLTKAAVKAYINPNVTDAEAELFLRYCIAHNLDPYRREVHLVKYEGSKDPAQMVVGVDCFMRRASQNPTYNGYKAGTITEKDGKLIYREGELLLKGETLIGGWCDVFREGRVLPRAQVGLNEYRRYKKDGSVTHNWSDKGMPATLIVKCAVVHGHRRAFPEDVGEMYVAEEMPVLEGRDQPKPKITILPPTAPVSAPAIVEAEAVEAEVIEANAEPLPPAPAAPNPDAFYDKAQADYEAAGKEFEASMEEAQAKAHPPEAPAPPPVKVDSLDDLRRKIGAGCLAMAGGNEEKAKDLLESYTSFKSKAGEEVKGKRDYHALTDKQVKPTFDRVNAAYKTWKLDMQALAEQGQLA